MRGLLGVDDRSGGFGPWSRWQRFVPLELRGLREERHNKFCKWDPELSGRAALLLRPEIAMIVGPNATFG